MLWPGWAFSRAMSPARLPLTSVVFRQAVWVTVVEATYFGVWLMKVADGSLAEVGQ
jgi:hypothetical protein